MFLFCIEYTCIQQTALSSALNSRLKLSLQSDGSRRSFDSKFHHRKDPTVQMNALRVDIAVQSSNVYTGRISGVFSAYVMLLRSAYEFLRYSKEF